MSTLKSKVLGSLVGAAAGDAMGAATELRTIEQIRADFGGWVTTFIAPPKDTFGRCNEAGMVTDDFTQGRFILEAALDQNGEVNSDVLSKAFERWMDYPFYPNFTGPTTRAAMQRILVINVSRCRAMQNQASQLRTSFWLTMAMHRPRMALQ